MTRSTVMINRNLFKTFSAFCKENGFGKGAKIEVLVKKTMSGDLLDISDLPRKEKDMIKKIVIGAKFN